MNNVEVALSLFVLRKTVEAHLTRVYRNWACGHAPNWPDGCPATTGAVDHSL
ncbi:MAG: hypothetical protein M3186_05405 [Actinomycetota bacterium]|nr:hypothetical protein [Actinomycetota bacterium]